MQATLCDHPWYVQGRAACCEYPGEPDEQCARITARVRFYHGPHGRQKPKFQGPARTDSGEGAPYCVLRYCPDGICREADLPPLDASMALARQRCNPPYFAAPTELLAAAFAPENAGRALVWEIGVQYSVQLQNLPASKTSWRRSLFVPHLLRSARSRHPRCTDSCRKVPLSPDHLHCRT